MAEAAVETNGAPEALASSHAAAAAGAAAAAAAAAAVAAAANSVTGAGGAGDKVPPPVEIKLFLGRVPQSMDEEGLRPVFEEFGEVREVIIIRDKTTGKHKNSAFVKMASIAAGDAAIRGLHNTRVLDSSMGPMSVKYATGEAERLGLSAQACEPGVPQAKLFVGSLPRTLKEEELRNFFQSYGQVDEVFIMKDNATGVGKGCAFVKMGQKEQALFAINSLNGKHTWEGCPRPMEVRFAESRAQRQMLAGGMGPMGARAPLGAPGGPMGGARPAVGGPMGGMGGPRMSPGMGGVGGAAMPPSNTNPRAAGPWKEYFSPEGRPYYHNEMTGITTWERPPEFMQVPPPVPPSGGAPGYGGTPHMGLGGGSGFGAPQGGAPVHQGGMDAGGEGPGGRDQSGPPGANIFVFHVPNDWNYYDLLNSFSQFGNVLSARVAMDRQSGRNKGYGFVSYETPEAAAAAVAAMNGFLAGGKRLKVTIKKGEEQHAVRASPMAYGGGAPGGGMGGPQAGRDAQWGAAGGYAQQTPGGYGGVQGGFGGPGAQQPQRFAPY